jgi:hypothetical protein
MQKTTPVLVGTCAWCAKPSHVEMTEETRERYERWKLLRHVSPWKAPLVQVEFPTLTAAEREQLITGTHGACWDAMLPPEVEE